MTYPEDKNDVEKAVSPTTTLLPSTWMDGFAGMTFGYGWLWVISAGAVGVSLPYFIGMAGKITLIKQWY